MSAFTAKDTNINAPLRWMRMERCLFVAGQIVKRSYTTMSLEGQTAGLMVENTAEHIIKLAEELYWTAPKSLWDDDDGGVEWEEYKRKHHKDLN